MDAWVVLPWRDIPLVDPVPLFYPAVPPTTIRMFWPRTVPPYLVDDMSDPRVIEREVVTLEGHLWAFPGGYRCVVYCRGEDEHRRFERRVRLAAHVVRALASLLELAGLSGPPRAPRG